MKKFMCVLLVLTMMLTMAACGSDEKTPVENNNAGGDKTSNQPIAEAKDDYFIWFNDTVINGLTEEGLKQTELLIPEKATEVTVLTSEKLERVAFENPDTIVRTCAFSNCPALKSVELPANQPTLEWGTFLNCISLESIELPDSITYIDSDVFNGCTALKSIKLGSGVTELASMAFDGCSALESIEIPGSVKTIGKWAFQGCTSLKQVTFGSGVETIEEGAFQSCVALETVDLPETVKTLGAYAFAFCDAMTEMYLPASLENLDTTAVAQTHNIKLYVVEGSLADQLFGELMGREYMEKIYR